MIGRRGRIPSCWMPNWALMERSRISPCLEETAVELAVECSSYRKAARTLESIVGYAVMSHEAIRQLVLEAPVSLHHPVSKRHGRVLFVEADGLFISR